MRGVVVFSTRYMASDNMKSEKHNMKISNQVLITLSVIALTGCSSTWVNLDNSKASNEKIVAAETNCQVVEKYHELYTKEMAIDLMKIDAETDEAKEELDKVYRNSERSTMAEINECMRSQGLMYAQ